MWESDPKEQEWEMEKVMVGRYEGQQRMQTGAVVDNWGSFPLGTPEEGCKMHVRILHLKDKPEWRLLSLINQEQTQGPLVTSWCLILNTSKWLRDFL